MRNVILSIVVYASIASVVGATIIGEESFDTYPDGNVAGQAGGFGFDYDILNGVRTGTPSNWDDVGPSPQVSLGTLITDGTSAKREYNGADEGNGSLRGNGVVFYRFDMTRSSGASWGGASSYDFGTERIFFGVPGAFGATDEAGIEITGVTNISSGIVLTDDVLYTLVAALDFDNSLVGLWVNPDATDGWNATGGTADATLEYTATNWSSATRLGSGGQVTWDNLRIATTPGEVGLIPEPSTVVLSVLGVVFLVLRRRRRDRF
jgi:hypothetical protein